MDDINLLHLHAVTDRVALASYIPGARRFYLWARSRGRAVGTLEDFEAAVLNRPATLTIVHGTGENGTVYDNIAACLPVDGEGFQPTGAYTRQKDRDADPY